MFFQIILPLVAPILVVVGLLGFIGAINEFLIASVFLTQSTSKTLAVGLYGLIAGERNANFGMFAAGTLLTAIPTVVLFYAPPALHRRRPDRRRGQGLTGRPRVDGQRATSHRSTTMDRRATPSPVGGDPGRLRLGDEVRLRVRAGLDAPVDRVFVRTAPDGEERFDELTEAQPGPACRWWTITLRVSMPVTGYRFLVVGPTGHYWLTGTGLRRGAVDRSRGLPARRRLRPARVAAPTASSTRCSPTGSPTATRRTTSQTAPGPTAVTPTRRRAWDERPDRRPRRVDGVLRRGPRRARGAGSITWSTSASTRSTSTRSSRRGPTTATTRSTTTTSRRTSAATRRWSRCAARPGSGTSG